MTSPLSPSSRGTSVPHCPVCSSIAQSNYLQTKDWIFERDETFMIVECRHCRVGFLNPRPSDEDLSSYYPDNYYSYREPQPYSLFSRTAFLAKLWYQVQRWRLFAKYGYPTSLALPRSARWIAMLPLPGFLESKFTFGLHQLFQPFVENGSLLEVGCGTGEYLNLMSELGWSRVVGVDVSEATVARARDRLGIEAYAGELAALTLPASSFDAASMSHTLEHVADPVALLAEVRRLLKPSGRLVVAVPNYDSQLRARYQGSWLALDAPRHLIHFTQHSLELALTRAGFSDFEVTTSVRGAYRVALFSGSRSRGDSPDIYTDDRHRFALRHRLVAAALAIAEWMSSKTGRASGEELFAVATNTEEK